MDGGEKEVIKNMGEDRVIISLAEDELLDSIANVDVYEHFILLRIKTKIAGNSFCESLSWKEFEAMRG